MWLHAKQQHDNHLTFKRWMLRKEKSKAETAVVLCIAVHLLSAQHPASQQVATVIFTYAKSPSLSNWHCAEAPLSLFFFISCNRVSFANIFSKMSTQPLAAGVPALTNPPINIDNWCFTLPEVLVPRREASSVPGQVLDSGTRNGCERCWGERPYRLLVAPVQLLTGGVQEELSFSKILFPPLCPFDLWG